MRPRRWRVAVAVGAALVAVGAVAPAAADRFGIEHVEVKQVPQLPDDVAVAPELGASTSLAEAQATVGFVIRVPALLGPPDGVHVGTPPDGVTLRWDEEDILITQHPGELAGVTKTVLERSRTTPVDVAGVPGLWLTGPHVVTFIEPDGTAGALPWRAGNTLVWSEDGVVTRIEVDGPLRGALDIAESMVP